jgi:23S rRNA (guanosine2251-2'-O)-methyltransferase
MQQKDFIYGRAPIIDHLKSGGTFEQILLQKGISREVSDEIRELAKAHRIPVNIVPIFKLNRVTRKNHQGVIAFTAWVEYVDVDTVIQGCYERGKTPLVVLLDRITDVRNMGAIARSAEVLGADLIILPNKESALINADAVKTSAGAIMKIPLSRSNSLGGAIRHLQESGLKVFAADHRSETTLYDLSFEGPAAIVLGSEGKGVHPGLIERADASFAIPQIGDTESLNVSVAAGIVLYEVLRQRKQSG